MRYSSFIFVFLILIIQQSSVAIAQRTQAEFDEMLEKMYEKTVPLIHVDQLDKDKLGEYVLLDTREEEEYMVSHIPGAKWVGYESLQKKKLKELDKDAPVIVYCSVGYRSERIGEKLQKMGFTNVQNLYGGIFDWKNKGNEVVNEKGRETDRIHTYNRDWSQWLFTGLKVF